MATVTQPAPAVNIDLSDRVSFSDLAIEFSVTKESLRRWRLKGLPSVRVGKVRYTTRKWFSMWLAEQNGIAIEPAPAAAQTSRARSAELSAVDRALDVAGI